MNVPNWLTTDFVERVVGLIFIIGGSILGIINFCRTGRLNTSAKNFIKGEFETMANKKITVRPVFGQSFETTRKDYVLNSVTNELEESPIPFDIQKYIQSHASTCLKCALDAFLNPDIIADGDNVTLVDSVGARNDMLEDLSYASEMFDMAETYRDKFGLSDDMSVSDIFAYVQKQADEMGERLKAQASEVDKQETDKGGQDNA